KRPQDRVPLPRVWESFKTAFAMDDKPANNDIARFDSEGGTADVLGEKHHATAVMSRPAAQVRNGSVVIAAITSCTNTSNPSVMVAAGLLAKRAVERGLKVSPTVKTSLAPGSRVVTDYLKAAGLMAYLEELGFYLVGYGCTTCIGNSGPLASDEVEAAVENWHRLSAPSCPIYEWDPASTYVQEPPFFENMTTTPAALTDIEGARALVIVGDSITTDHISPAGSIPPDSPAGHYLIEHGVERAEFNSYGARRGNHEILMRGTFGNIRLRNLLTEREGYWTIHLPDRQEMTIFDAAERYRAEGVPLIAIAGKEYGSGSSRDWAAKGP